MNVLGKRERSWRKARKRGVSPIIATILLVAITVVLAAVLYVLISSLTTGGASTVPIGTAFSFGAPAQSSNAHCAATTAGYCYSVGVQSAGTSATTGNIHFAVLKSGTGVAFTSVQVLDITGAVIATWNGATWSGSAVPLAFNSTLTLLVSYASGSITGDSLEAIGVGALQGTTSVVLP